MTTFAGDILYNEQYGHVVFHFFKTPLLQQQLSGLQPSAWIARFSQILDISFSQKQQFSSGCVFARKGFLTWRHASACRSRCRRMQLASEAYGRALGQAPGFGQCSDCIPFCGLQPTVHGEGIHIGVDASWMDKDI